MMDDLLQEMIDPEPRRADVSRWRRLGATAAIFALAGLGITSLTTSALFTDRETTAGDLLTGTVDVSLGADGAPGATFFAMPDGGLPPGGAVARTVTVTNSGSLQLRYAVSFHADAATRGDSVTGTDTPLDSTDAEAVRGAGDLRDVLTLDVFPVGASDGCATTGAAPAGAGTITDLTRGTGTLTDGFSPILGDATQEPFTGAARTLASGRSELLCVRVTLDPSAGNEYQNTDAPVQLRFDAEQVVNNPSGTATQAG